MEFNRFVEYWQAKTTHSNHQKTLRSIQPVIRMSRLTPPTKQPRQNQPPCFNNRTFEIELQNRALLTKLLNERSRNELSYSKDIHNGYKIGKAVPKMKKNLYFQEFEKENNNKGLLKKLKNAKTTYKLEEFMDDYKEKEKIMSLICKYPRRGIKPTKTLLKLPNTKLKSESIIQRTNTDRPKRTSTDKNNNFTDRSMRPSRNKNEKGSKRRVKTTTNQDTEHSPKKQPMPQPIPRIFNVERIQIDGEEVFVKGVQFQGYLLLQLEIKGKIKELKIKNSIFDRIFMSDFQKICDGLQYDEYLQEFYI